MQIHQLKRAHLRKRKRQVGRGGKRGKTSGRGTKGQRARAGRKLRPELRDIIKKLPKRRGSSTHGPLRPIGAKPVVVNLGAIDKRFAAGTVITPALLVKEDLIRKKGKILPAVKILGGGVLTKKFTFENCLFSAAAKLKIEQHG
ncbi:MAG: uL15 family ribosomal protein [Candidatus Vogelbacteria bacterium]|nr:uL15 family ribosomal protein [Candidatus Vogelbacteria bacterium]